MQLLDQGKRGLSGGTGTIKKPLVTCANHYLLALARTHLHETPLTRVIRLLADQTRSKHPLLKMLCLL